MARLIMQREGRTKEYELGEETVLGRKSSCTVRVPSPKCSREHCQIVKGSGGFFAEDMGSANGTLVNGKKVGRQLLKNGDVITIGGIDYTFQDKTDDPLVGKRLGKYQIIDKVGVGGMGVVYRASQVTLGREVALKVMSPRLATKVSFIQSFEREAKIAARLQHPNIIGIHDFGHEAEWYFFSMEFVEGENLLDMALRQGGLSVDECLEYGRQLADALDHAHNQGILHKDIKPQNVMINNEDRVKLADMGLASIADEENQSSSPEQGAFMATPQYVAPEIIRRQEPDARSDLYSLAATLFHMLTSKPPYTGADVKDLLKKHLSAPIPDPRTLRPDIPEEVALFVMKGLSKDPADRPQTARAFADELARLQHDPQPRPAASAEKRTFKPQAAALMKAATTRNTAAVVPDRPERKPLDKKLYYYIGGGAAALLLLVVVLLAARTNPEVEAAKLLQEANASYIGGNDTVTREKLELLVQRYPRAAAAAQAQEMLEMFRGSPAQQELYRAKKELESGKSDSKKLARQMKSFLQQGNVSNDDQRAIKEFIIQLGEDPDIRSEWEKQVDDLVAAERLYDALTLARKTEESSAKPEDKARAAQVRQMVQNKIDGKAEKMFSDARSLCDKGENLKAADGYAAVILAYAGTDWQMQAANELAGLNDSAVRAFGMAWNGLFNKAQALDLPGARELAFQKSKELGQTSLAGKGRELELYAEGLNGFCEKLLATAKEKTKDAAGQVRIPIDGKERTVSLDAEGGKLYAVGQKNRKQISIADIPATEVSRLMPARSLEAQEALGGAVYFASHKAPEIALEYIRILEILRSDIGAAGRDLRMLLAQQAPLMNYEDVLTGKADQLNCRVLNNDTLAFFGEGSYLNPRLAMRLNDLRVQFTIGDRCIIEALGKGGTLFTLTRKGDTLEAQAGDAKQTVPYAGEPMCLSTTLNDLHFFCGGKDVGTLPVTEIGMATALFRLRSAGSTEIKLLEFGVNNPLTALAGEGAPAEAGAAPAEVKPEEAKPEEVKAEEVKPE